MCIFGPSLIFPDFGVVWRCCITKFHLYEIPPLYGWAELVTALREARIRTPLDLAALTLAESTVLDDVQEARGGALCSFGSRPSVGGRGS